MLEKKPLAHPDEVRRFAHGALRSSLLQSAASARAPSSPGGNGPHTSGPLLGRVTVRYCTWDTWSPVA